MARLSSHSELKAQTLTLNPFSPIGLPSGSIEFLSNLVRAAEEELLVGFLKETGYREKDARDLWQAIYIFLQGIVGLIEVHHQLGEQDALSVNAISNQAFTEYHPWGKFLVCIPSNAPIPLGFIIPIALIASGNSVVVSSSSETGRALAEMVQKVFPDRLIVWNGRVRESIKELVETRLVDVLYFMGSSRIYADIAETCARAGVTLLYEGEGNGVAVLSPTLRGNTFDDTVKVLIESKAFCHGYMCSAPNVVAVPASLLAVFSETFERYNNMALPITVREAAGEATWNLIQSHLSSGTETIPEILDFESISFPFLVRNDDLAKALETELFCPVSYVLVYDDWSELLDSLYAVRHRLQISLFTEDSHEVEELIRTTGFARYCVNQRPTDQNPLLPWGNYGFSGYSDVQNFFSKGLRRIIVEGVVRPSQALNLT